jgi:DNA polymerase III sliding clamp (beta) subunit (PCNA family)
MKEYLENRINELKEAEVRAFEKRWDINTPEIYRSIWREQSNELTACRHELENALEFLNLLHERLCSMY